MFCDEKIPDEIIKQTFNIEDKKNWKLKEKREIINKDNKFEEIIMKLLYRPFDIKWVFYHDDMIERPRKEVMRHMMKDNISICVGRAGQVVGLDKPWNIVFCANYIEDYNLFYRGGNVNLPLYLYPYTDKNHIFNQDADAGTRKPNIHPGLFSVLGEAYGGEPSPEDLLLHLRHPLLQYLSQQIRRVPQD